MRTAVVHDWLVDLGGAERVLKEILGLVPAPDLYCMIYAPTESLREFLGVEPAGASLVQHLPFATTRHRAYMPLMPFAVEQIDLRGYDIVVSSSYAVAKGVITSPAQVHIAYVHSPMRYAWDLQHEYLERARLGFGPRGLLARAILHYLRIWDVRTAHGVDHYIANSRFIASRIMKVYGRSASVIHPPVDVGRFKPSAAREEFFLTVSRLVPYKRVDLVVDTFRHHPELNLKVIGDGPESERIRRRATPNVELLGFQSDAVVAQHMARCRAFVFAAEEDFGLVPLEAQAAGAPIIAYGRGGATETVRAGVTGLFFAEQTVAGLSGALQEFLRIEDRFDAVEIRNHAEAFGPERFRREFADLLGAAMREKAAMGSRPSVLV